MPLRTVLICLTAGVLLASASAARAQFGAYARYGNYSSNQFVNSNLKLFFNKRWQINRLRAQGKHQVADAMEGRSSQGQANSHAPAADTAGAGQIKVPLSMSAFTAAGAPSIPKRVAASLAGVRDEQRQELEEAFRELLRAYNRLLEESGEQRLKNNLAGAFNFLFTVSFYALKNGKELTDAQQENMLQQVNAAIALGLKERPLSNREKQDAYEAAALSGMLILGLYNEARDEGRPEQMETARKLARDLLEEMMGISIDKVRVSANSVQID